MEEEDYWTKSDVKKFNFDEDDGRVNARRTTFPC